MEECTPPRRGDHPVWLLALLGLLAWQAWLALSLFGPDRPLERLLDDQPILSGRHPLHLYHGYLGAHALHEQGTLSCYDPAFHAGYPKTPVFDSGSRPAELVLALVGGRYCPAAYKVGLALLCAIVPLLLYAAGRGVGLSRASACLACGLGLLVWWGQPCRDALEAGEIDLLLATLLVLAQAGLLIRYHRAPGLFSLAGVVLTAALGWFAHPLLLALLLPLFLIYYLSVGTKHRLTWHVALLGGLLAAVGVNAFWLLDWINYWWIRVPPRGDMPLLAHRTLRTVWEAPLWGGPVDRIVARLLIVAALAGVFLYNAASQRATARLLGLGWGGFLVLAVFGISWEPLARLGAAHLIVPALLFAALPAAHALVEGLGMARRATGRWWPAALLGSGLVAGTAVLLAPPALGVWAGRLRAAEPLQVGLGPTQLAVVETLRARTTEDARVLWEDRRGERLAPHWTALLPILTGRAYVGGLDPDAGIEHTASGLADQALAGRALEDWSSDELRRYCERYNVGWVVCWSPKARARLAAWPDAERTADLPDPAGGVPGQLFTVRRPHSFTLRGSAQWLRADTHQIVLRNAVPEPGRADDGEVGQILLSLHYQSGMRVSPSRVRLERAEEAGDPIPFVRLRVAEPAALITITWQKR